MHSIGFYTAWFVVSNIFLVVSCDLDVYTCCATTSKLHARMLVQNVLSQYIGTA
jgi:hypothetical protein